MAFENAKAEIALLFAQFNEQPHDRQELEFLLRERLSALKAFGMPLPADLVALEAALDRELAGEAPQGVSRVEVPRQ